MSVNNKILSLSLTLSYVVLAILIMEFTNENEANKVAIWIFMPYVAGFFMLYLGGVGMLIAYIMVVFAMLWGLFFVILNFIRPARKE